MCVHSVDTLAADTPDGSHLPPRRRSSIDGSSHRSRGGATPDRADTTEVTQLRSDVKYLNREKDALLEKIDSLEDTVRDLKAAARRAAVEDVGVSDADILSLRDELTAQAQELSEQANEVAKCNEQV